MFDRDGASEPNDDGNEAAWCVALTRPTLRFHSDMVPCSFVVRHAPGSLRVQPAEYLSL